VRKKKTGKKGRKKERRFKEGRCTKELDGRVLITAKEFVRLQEDKKKLVIQWLP